MSEQIVRCPKCQAPVSPASYDRPGMVRCFACQAQMAVKTYPALTTVPVAGARGEAVIADDQASCFYHAGKKAAVPCDQCGRFLCSLCDIPVGGRHLCPACIQGGPQAQSSEFDASRPLRDSLALSMAWWPLMVTPLVSLYMAIRYWSTPGSLVRTVPWRWVAAVIISLGQLCFWFWIFAMAFG